MEGGKKSRKVAFRPDEVTLLLDEVEAHKGVLFCRFKGNVTNRDKQKAWDDIARTITATRGVKREGKEARKKWQDFSSLAKRKGEMIRSSMAKMGGGAGSALTLTPEEEKALSILGPTALEGIEGGIDLHGGCEPVPSNPDTAPQNTSEGPSSPPHSPTPQPQPSCPQPSSPVRVGRRRRGFSSICGCSKDFIELEMEKLEVLKDLRKVTVEAFQETLRFQEEVLKIKRAKLALMERQVDVAERQYERPAISVPILLKNEQGPSEGTVPFSQKM